MYLDPGEIKRDNKYPDVWTIPDVKRKTPKPDDHLPTCTDHKDIKHADAPDTGDLYTVSFSCFYRKAPLFDISMEHM